MLFVLKSIGRFCDLFWNREFLNRTGSSFCFEMFAGVERFCDFVLKKMGEKIKIKQKKKGGLEKKILLLH